MPGGARPRPLVSRLAFPPAARHRRGQPRGVGAEGGLPGGLRHPTGIAVDGLDRLYVAESAAGVVLVADLWTGRVLRRVPVAGHPADVVVTGGDAEGVLVLTAGPDAVVRIDGAADPCAKSDRLQPPCGYRTLRPVRLTLLSGRVVVLWTDKEDAVVADLEGREILHLPGAADIEGRADGLLVAATNPGDPIRRFHERDGGLIEDQPLAAAGYDGGAVTIAPSGRIVYTTTTGHRSTQGPLVRHVRLGTVTTYRLDAAAYRTRWGRVFIEACLPTGTALRVRAFATDEDDVADPRLADDGWLPVVAAPAHGIAQALDPLGSGSEWARYETGAKASPGRYLWLQLELSGTERTSPRVRALAIERPGHALLDALPRMYSRDDDHADFLHGFLAPAEAILHDLDTAAAERRVLLDPRTVPSDALPWLASLAGLVLDLRWPEEARRALLAEAYALYARRGTAGALERWLRLYLGRSARIVERWRLRGLGGSFLGLGPEGLASPTVVGTTRTSGMLGHFTVGGRLPDSDSYRDFAHRFTVLIPGCLTAEQRDVVGDIIDAHKPSHTVADVCELGDGLPVGRLRIGLTAYVGPRRGRRPSTLGRYRLGPGSPLGAAPRGPVGAAQVGAVRVGKVRVG